MQRLAAGQRRLRPAPAAQRPRPEKEPNAHAAQRSLHAEVLECWVVGWTCKPPRVLPVEAHYPCPAPTYSSASRPEAFVVHAVVKAGDIVAVTIEQERRSPLASPDDLLARLAPTRMRHLRIDIRPEAILRGLQRFPHAPRTFIREAEVHNRLD